MTPLAVTFLQPWASWFLAGIPLIVLLYLARLKRREITVSTHLFWQRILRENSRRTFFRRLRNVWSLLLQILIFLLIAGALARPIWSRHNTAERNLVLIVDARARMQAIEPDGQSRFAKAVAAASSAIRQVNPQTRVALVSVSDSARVEVPFTDDEVALRKALESLRVTDAAGDASNAVELAESMLAARTGDGRSVLYTDRPLEKHGATSVQTFGSSRDNIAITRFASRPNPANPETAEFLLELRNFSNNAASTTVELALDGRVFDARPVQLTPNQQRIEVFSSVPKPMPGSNGWLTARITTEDALPSDNVAYAVHPARAPRRVLLVSNGNPFLEKMLRADAGNRFQFIEPTAWQPGLAEKFEAVIFDRVVPAGFNWETAAGNYLLIGVNPFAPNGGDIERPLITEVAENDPAIRGASLQNIGIQKARNITMPRAVEGWKFRAPIQSFDHPLLVIGSNGQHRLAVIAFDILESDLPLRVAFPLLMSQILQGLDTRDLETPPALQAGESMALNVGEKVSVDPLISPAKSLPPLVNAGFFHPLYNGFYRAANAESARWIAVNTFSPGESDLRINSIQAQESTTISMLPSASWPVWTWLTLAALGLFTGEWWLFHRRKTE